MSTCYGHAIVAFPGLPPIHFRTAEGWILPWIGQLGWGYAWPHFLPPRAIRTKDGRVLRLSRKERSRLRSHMRRWSQRNAGRDSWRQSRHGTNFRTLEFNYCDY